MKVNRYNKEPFILQCEIIPGPRGYVRLYSDLNHDNPELSSYTDARYNSEKYVFVFRKTFKYWLSLKYNAFLTKSGSIFTSLDNKIRTMFKRNVKINDKQYTFY